MARTRPTLPIRSCRSVCRRTSSRSCGRPAAESGLSVSATIGAALRRMLAEVEQEGLDRALELDAEENLAWANAYLPIAAKLWAELEW